MGSNVKLRQFKVQAWLKDLESKDGQRIPLKEMTITASDGKQAAIVYASCNGIKRDWWWGPNPKPYVVIRVELIGAVQKHPVMDARMYK